MKRTTRNAARTKQEIIQKSAPVFNVHGYAGTSMQMLVDATGFQMGGIYRHFNTKMDVALAVFQYNYETVILPNLNINTKQTPPEQLLTILDNYQKMILQPEVAGGCPILNTVTEMDDTNERFRALAQSYVEEILSKIEGILRE
ncbi:MAG: TetR/AcrR family transcriptional regulator, partial [Bacteroidota bacterium]